MRQLTIPTRYQRWFPLAGGTWEDEGQFGFEQRTFEIPVAQAALVLVDCWTMGWGPEPLAPDLGWIAEMNPSMAAARRARDVIDKHVHPVLEAAREVGMTVVHAPAPEVAVKYALPAKYQVSPPPASGTGNAPPWPPRPFVNRLAAQHRRDWRSDEWDKPYQELCRRGLKDIAPPLKPKGDDLVVATGAQLDAICRDREILHLFYVGGALNFCIVFRDYGVYQMGRPWGRGYNCMVLRDCVISAETHETYREQDMNKYFLQWYELVFGYTTEGPDLIKACRSVGRL